MAVQAPDRRLRLESRQLAHGDRTGPRCAGSVFHGARGDGLQGKQPRRGRRRVRRPGRGRPAVRLLAGKGVSVPRRPVRPREHRRRIGERHPDGRGGRPRPLWQPVRLLGRPRRRRRQRLCRPRGRRALGKMYAADERCTSCGWCERACPARTIVLRGWNGSRRLPRWGWRCEACQRCINGCPEDAIQVPGLRIAALIVAALPWGLLVVRSIPRLSVTGSWILAWLVGAVLLPSLVDLVLRLLERVPGIRRLAQLGHTRKFRRYRGPRGSMT